MFKHFLYGTAAPELGWVPAPRYILRRSRVLHHLKIGKGRRSLDIGCGAGALLLDLYDRGFEATGLESGPEAASVAKALAVQTSIKILSDPDPQWRGTFDVISAFEVLEHIKDDHEALGIWVSWLKPGGLFLVSVPCHMKRWTVSDDWAGHVRRYERQELKDLFEKAGLDIVVFESYGFPLVNLVSGRRTKYYQAEMDKRSAIKDLDQSTASSGVDRSGLTGVFNKMCTWPGLMAMWLSIQLQRPFLRTDLGDGYFVVGRFRGDK
ncbi:class I SAM-dependent methyltransferase [Mesorhizobium sp. M0618]|uniref:class I SAM-dependent methyltransferase n=1 Tax=unclassified Mesorhizobium TaxID=325217 RepID=UPI00333AB895